MLEKTKDNKFLDKMNWGLYHEQWFCDNPSQNIGFGDNGPIINNDYEYVVKDDSSWVPDQLLNEAARKYNPQNNGKYKLFDLHDLSRMFTHNPTGKTNNCQVWAEKIRNEVNAVNTSH